MIIVNKKLGWGGNVLDMKKEKPVEVSSEETKPAEGVEIKEPEIPKREMLFLDIFGEIRRPMVQELVRTLRPSVEETKIKRLFISFCSNGGDVSHAYHIDNIIKSWSGSSVAICGSINASGSTLLIAKRDLRLSWSNARFMLHDIYGINDGSIAQQEEVLRTTKEERNNIIQDYMDYVGLTKKEIEKILRMDTYFNAYEALNLGTKGLIDGIIIKMLGDFKVLVEMRNGIQKTIDLHDDDFISVKDLTVATVVQAKIDAENKSAEI